MGGSFGFRSDGRGDIRVMPVYLDSVHCAVEAVVIGRELELPAQPPVAAPSTVVLLLPHLLSIGSFDLARPEYSSVRMSSIYWPMQLTMQP